MLAQRVELLNVRYWPEQTSHTDAFDVAFGVKRTCRLQCWMSA